MDKIYAKGRRKEYKIRNEFIAAGFDIVQRTAGSHSPIDIIAINKKTKEIILIQAKAYADIRKKFKEYTQYEWLNDEFKVKFIIR